MCVENRYFVISLHSTPPLGVGFPSQYSQGLVWTMAWLPDGEKRLTICLFIFTEYTNVTDGRTDRHRMTFIHSIARQKSLVSTSLQSTSHCRKVSSGPAL